MLFTLTSGPVSVTKNPVHTVRSEIENDIILNRYKYLMLVIRTRFGVNKATWPPFQLCETNLKFSINDLAKTSQERRKIRIPNLRNRNRQKNSKTWNVCSFASRHCMSGTFHLKFFMCSFQLINLKPVMRSSFLQLRQSCQYWQRSHQRILQQQKILP